ncbi:hypothetical protein Pam1_18 [Pseudanabaena phage Pam1]|nr:hypothetical protein Pam1_18 [Pseudanabaena phage Pam1]
MSERPTLASLSTRVAVIETRNEAKDRADAEMAATVKAIDAKLTELVALKNKGTGAAWLLGIIWASGIIGGMTTLWHWLKG